MNDLTELSDLCPSGFMIGFRFQNSRPIRCETTYPPSWLTAYSERNMIMSDPLIAWALTNSGWARWTQISADFSDPLKVMEGAAQHGLCFGLAFSLGETRSRTMAGAARGDREFTHDEAEHILTVLRRLHAKTSNSVSLTSAQLDALRAYAQGVTYDEICDELGISRTALRLRMERVRNAFGLDENIEAVRRARQQGLLPARVSPGSITGASYPPAPRSEPNRRHFQSV